MRRPRIRVLTDRIHVSLVLSAIALVGYGTLVVWSAMAGMQLHDTMFKRHVLGLAIGLLPLVGLGLLDYQKWKGWTGPMMLALSLLIISPRIPGIGYASKGAVSWLQIAGVRLFQPSEPAKLLYIVVMAAVIAEFGGRIADRRDIARIIGYAGFPVLLILLQPDLGTGMVFAATALGMLLVGGMRGRYFAIAAVAALILVGLLLALPGPLKEYQKNRLLVFVDPSRDPQGAGYNLAQSKIAIGSGGLTGKGLGAKSSQSNLNFLPERHTDFIFSVLGEQLGFVGAVVLLGLYLALLTSALSISTSSRDLFGALIAAGLISMWLFQIVENVGMTIGLMPITGVPLPFMSYGSSAMVSNLAGVGMLLSVWSRRYGT
jgi:rod shape determining protein RodA